MLEMHEAAVAPRVDRWIPSAAIIAIMECVKEAQDRASLIAFRHDIKHRSIVNLLNKRLEAGCSMPRLHVAVNTAMGIQFKSHGI